MTFVGIPFLWHIRDVPAWIFLGLWFLGQFFIRRVRASPGWRTSAASWRGLGAVRLLAGTRPRTAHRGARRRVLAAAPPWPALVIGS